MVMSEKTDNTVLCAAMVKEIQKSRGELLRSLELFYKVVILGEALE